LYLPTPNHLLIVNKLLSLSLSLSASLSPSLPLNHLLIVNKLLSLSVGDWGGPATVWSLLYVAETRVTRPNGEWGYSTRRTNAGPRVPSGGVTLKRRCTEQPSVIYLIVNKLLSLSLLDRRRSGPSCMLPKGVSYGQTESGGIVLAAICWAPSAQRRCYPTGCCTYRPSVIY